VVGSKWGYTYTANWQGNAFVSYVALRCAVLGLLLCDLHTCVMVTNVYRS
jgi:hypothetical protein